MRLCRLSKKPRSRVFSFFQVFGSLSTHLSRSALSTSSMVIPSLSIPWSLLPFILIYLNYGSLSFIHSILCCVLCLPSPVGDDFLEHKNYGLPLYSSRIYDSAWHDKWTLNCCIIGGVREAHEGGDICIYRADSLHSTAQTNITLKSNYTPTKNFF